MSGRGVGSAEVAQNVLPQDHLDFAGPVGKAEVTNWEDSMKTSRLSAVIFAVAPAAMFQAGGPPPPPQKEKSEQKNRRETASRPSLSIDPLAVQPPRASSAPRPAP